MPWLKAEVHIYRVLHFVPIDYGLSVLETKPVTLLHCALICLYRLQPSLVANRSWPLLCSRTSVRFDCRVEVTTKWGTQYTTGMRPTATLIIGGPACFCRSFRRYMRRLRIWSCRVQIAHWFNVYFRSVVCLSFASHRIRHDSTRCSVARQSLDGLVLWRVICHSVRILWSMTSCLWRVDVTGPYCRATGQCRAITLAIYERCNPEEPTAFKRSHQYKKRKLISLWCTTRYNYVVYTVDIFMRPSGINCLSTLSISVVGLLILEDK